MRGPPLRLAVGRTVLDDGILANAVAEALQAPSTLDNNEAFAPAALSLKAIGLSNRQPNETTSRSP